jgi:hypothetical protein
VTPALPDVLMGVVRTLATPSPPESSGEFMAGKIGIVSMLLMLCAQEAEKGLAVRVWENAAMRERLGETATERPDFRLSILDAENARLRTLLITAHAEAEARGDVAADRAFLELYKAMADARHLDIPGG